MNALFLAAFAGDVGFANNDVDWVVVAPLIGLAPVQWIMLAWGVVLLLALAAISWLLVHLLGQNGRLLVRLEQIEAAIEEAGIDLEEDEGEEVEALPIGSPAPALSLSRLSGKMMTLDALRAAKKPVVLIFSDPTCIPCNALMPEVSEWQREHAEKLTFAIVSRGALEENRKKFTQHNLAHVLVQQGSEISEAYQVVGTPTAVLVRADGTIGSGLAAGADNIRALVRRASRRQAAILRQKAAANTKPMAGLANIGKDAPIVELKNLDGETVRLADFAGHPTAVLFWNPGCGFCQRMVDDLKTWEANPPQGAPKLLVVSTGEAEANRQVGLTSPIVLDSGFAIASSFGASGTPSAVLVGAEGKIASGLAVGGPTVLSLLRNESPRLLDPSAAQAEAPEAPRGLPVGKKAPRVELPNLEGKQIDLHEIRNGRTALLFWNPGCGFCQRLVNDLKEWERGRGEGAPQLVLISTGSAEANREHGLNAMILLDDGFRTGGVFGATGTPSAILIDVEGNVASGLVVGGPNVMGLLRS